MPYPVITFKFKEESLERFITNIVGTQRALSNFRPFWEFLWEKYFIQEVKQVFDTEGGGKWPERTSGGDHPLLRKSPGIPLGRLYRSYTQRRLSSNITRFEEGRFEFGSNLPYARIHETGAPKINVPARPVIGTLTERLRGGGGALRAYFEEYFGGLDLENLTPQLRSEFGSRFTSKEQSQLIRRDAFSRLRRRTRQGL